MKLFSLLVCFCLATRAQAPASDAQTLQALLTEVHQLRIALERSTQIAPRIQIAVEDRNRETQPRIQQRLEHVSSAAAAIADPQQRKDYDLVLKEVKLQSEQAEKSLQQMQVREGELASQLQFEQARLTELNDRLDQMERALNMP